MQQCKSSEVAVEDALRVAERCECDMLRVDIDEHRLQLRSEGYEVGRIFAFVEPLRRVVVEVLDYGVRHLVERAICNLLENLGEFTGEVVVRISSCRYPIQCRLTHRLESDASLIYGCRELLDGSFQRLLILVVFDDISGRFFEQLIGQSGDGVADIPLLAITNALLGEIFEPFAQLGLLGDILNQLIDALCKHGSGIQLGREVHIDIQLTDKCSQNSLKKGVVRKDGEVRIVVQNQRTNNLCSLSQTLLVERGLLHQIFEVVALLARCQQMNLFQYA